MAISVKCSDCSRSYQVRDELAGKQAKCKCGQVLQIPAADALGDLLDQELPAMGEPGRSDEFSPAGDPMQGPPQIPGGALGTLPPRRKRRPKPLLLAGVAAGCVAGLAVVVLVVSGLGGSEDGEPQSAPVTRLPQESSYKGTASATPPRNEGPSGSVDPSLPPPPSSAGQRTNRIDLTPPTSASRRNRAPTGPGYETPEEACRAFWAAVMAVDVRTVFHAMTPVSQDMTVTDTAFALRKAARTYPQLRSVLTKHGILESFWAGLARRPPTKKTGNMGDLFKHLERAARIRNQIRDQILGAVDDQCGFLVDALEAVRAARGKELSEDVRERVAEYRQALREAKLIDLEIDDDTARGKLALTYRGKAEELTSSCRRINGRWYFDEVARFGL